jgi:hypothetical protein
VTPAEFLFAAGAILGPYTVSVDPDNMHFTWTRNDQDFCVEVNTRMLSSDPATVIRTLLEANEIAAGNSPSSALN